MKHTELASLLSGIPFFTLTLAAVSLILHLTPELLPYIQFDRAGIASGEWWRLMSCHWVHWSFDHFLWCTLTLVSLGSVCERISLKGYAATLAAASVAIPLLLWFTNTEMLIYRGLSGLVSSVFVYTATLLAHRAFTRKDRLLFPLSLFGGTGYLVKIIYEYSTGTTLFVASAGVFSPVPAAHLAGGVIGLAVFSCGFTGKISHSGTPFFNRRETPSSTWLHSLYSEKQ